MSRAGGVVGLTLIISLLVSVGRAQSPAPPQILELARNGAIADAWAAWTALPPGPSKLELGIEIAAATNQIPRGLSLYGELVAVTKAPHVPSLRVLALATAADLLRSDDVDLVALACGAALSMDPAHAPCRRALEARAQTSTTAQAQAVSVYALATAGLDPFPGLRDQLERGLAVDDRLRLAATLTRLPARDRLALVQPLLYNADVSVQSDAVRILADVPGDEVLATLRNLRGSPSPVREAARLALACHGDEAGLAELASSFSTMVGPDRLMAAAALARAQNARGLTALRSLARSGAELERVQAAEALARFDPGLAAEVLTTSLDRGSATVAPAALRAAGAMGLGTDASVYRRLTDASPEIRAGAVDAIAATLTRSGVR